MLAILTLIALLAPDMTETLGAPVSVCAIAAYPERFNGKTILVRGTVLPDRHGIGLIDSDCPQVLIVLGSSASDAPGSTNSRFYDVYWHNFLPDGRAITATFEGEFVYVAAQWPVRRLDTYRVVDFVVEPGRRPQ